MNNKTKNRTELTLDLFDSSRKYIYNKLHDEFGLLPIEIGILELRFHHRKIYSDISNYYGLSRSRSKQILTNTLYKLKLKRKVKFVAEIYKEFVIDNNKHDWSYDYIEYWINY